MFFVWEHCFIDIDVKSDLDYITINHQLQQ